MSEPVLRVVRGNPTAEELAALVAVLLGGGPDDAGGAPASPSAWNDPAARVRSGIHPGPGAWRRSALPR
jgi:hypothetical protein